MYILNENRWREIMNINRLKTQQIRVNKVQEIIDFYEGFSTMLPILYTDHLCYAEGFYEKKNEFQKDYEKYVISIVKDRKNFETNLEQVLQRIAERTVLLKEACQYIISCLTALIQPKQVNRKGEMKKITKSSLLSVLNEIERTILSINVKREEFSTHLFMQTHAIRKKFLVDAYMQILSLLSVEREEFEFLFSNELNKILSVSQKNSNVGIIKEHRKIKKDKNLIVKYCLFFKGYSRRYFLKEERAIANNIKD